MTDPLITAEQKAAEARERLMGTVGSLQSRLDPRSVARDAVDGIADTGQRAIEAAVDAAQRNPGKLAGAAAVIALFAGRRQIAALFGRKPKTSKPGRARHVSPNQKRHPRRDEEAS